MTIYKCDKCKKTMKRESGVRIEIGFEYLTLCYKCSGSIINFLRDNKLASKGLSRAGKTFKELIATS